MISPLVLRTGSFWLIFFILLGIESLAPFARSEQKKSFRVVFHLGLNIANSILLYLIIAGPILAALSLTERHQIGLSYLLGLKGGFDIAATIAVFDLWDYWMHRLNHRIGFLWRFHKAHHTDMEIDVTTAARFHLGELLISNSIKGLMVLLWGPSLWGLVLFDTGLTGASLFHHSNIRIPWAVQDWIEKFTVTPRMHRCHHALHSSCFNTNFSAILSCWDRLFGSYHRSRDRSELTWIGLPQPRGSVTMMIRPFLLTPIKNQ